MSPFGRVGRAEDAAPRPPSWPGPATSLGIRHSLQHWYRCHDQPSPAPPRTCSPTSRPVPTSWFRWPTASRSRCSTRIEAARRRARRRAGAPDARAARPPLPPRRLRRPPAARVVLPLARDAAGASTRAACRPRARQLQRGAAAPARASSARWSSPRRRRPTGTATSRSARTADYIAVASSARAPFFLEVNAQMPRTFGRNQVHVSARWSAGARPTTRSSSRAAAPSPTTIDARIAALVAERDPRRRHDPGRHRRDPERDPRRRCGDHRDLGVHTELLSDGRHRPGRGGRRHRRAQAAQPHQGRGDVRAGQRSGCTTSSTRTRPSSCGRSLRQRPAGHRPGAELRVDQRDARGRPPRPVRLGDRSAAATGPASGGQADFARGAMYSPGGQGFIVLRSTARDGRCRAIVPQLHARRGRHDASRTPSTRWSPSTAWPSCGAAPIAERARALIAIADPSFRDDLQRQAKSLGFL